MLKSIDGFLVWAKLASRMIRLIDLKLLIRSSGIALSRLLTTAHLHVIPFFNINWPFWSGNHKWTVRSVWISTVSPLMLELSKVCVLIVGLVELGLATFKHLLFLSFIQLLTIHILLAFLPSAPKILLKRWNIVFWKSLMTRNQMHGRLILLILLFCDQRLYIKLMKQISAVLQEQWQGVLLKLGQSLFHVFIWVEVLNPFIICFAHMLAEFLDTREQFGHTDHLFMFAAVKLWSSLGSDDGL
jgi:hypothetical protein